MTHLDLQSSFSLSSHTSSQRLREKPASLTLPLATSALDLIMSYIFLQALCCRCDDGARLMKRVVAAISPYLYPNLLFFLEYGVGDATNAGASVMLITELTNE